jgi:hypothetical protein
MLLHSFWNGLFELYVIIIINDHYIDEKNPVCGVEKWFKGDIL